MTVAVRRIVRIQPGGVVEVQSPVLPAGEVAEVIVLLEPVPARMDPPSLASLIGAAKGGFASVAEADTFVRQERDAWDF